MNLNESTIKIDVNSLKSHLAEKGIDYSINQIKDDLKSLNAVVRAEQTEDGGLYMVVGGDIDMDRLESVFDECMVDVNDFIVDDIPDIENYGVDFDDIDDDLYECDAAPLTKHKDFPAFENVETDYPSFEDVEINEKKKGCCPKKRLNERKTTSIESLSKKHYSRKVDESKKGTPISSLSKEHYRKNSQASQHLIPLKEALSGKEIKFDKNPDVNEIIDSLTGKKNSRRINEAALAKARKESKKHINENYEFLSRKLGEDLAGRIWKALSEKKTSLYEKVKINGKAVSDFTLDELRQVYEKVCRKVDELEQTTKTDGLNETDATNSEKKLALNIRLKTILTEEIEFRSALKEADDSADAFLDQFNLDPNAENGDDNNDNGDENGDDNNDADKSDDDKNDNPDNDQVEEIGSIVITMSSEKAANDLKDELVQEGIPEDVIEIEPVEDEDSDDNSDEDNSSDENDDNGGKSDENGEENEKPNESKSAKVNGHKLNEDDDNNDTDADADNGGDDQDAGSDDNDDAGNDDDADDDEKQYKVILTDTDYADKLQAVMADIYGIEQSEFENMIGGTIVNDDDDNGSDDDDDKNNSSDDSSSDDNKDDDGGGDDDSDDDIDPETIFKGL